jgi:hypothetical protein
MDTGASAIDRPDPTIVDFVENSRLIPRGMSARFERLPGGVSSDIWLVHADDTSFCIKRALAQLRVAADWRAPIERNTKEAAWIKAVAGFMPEAVPSLLAEGAQAGMFAMDYLSPRSFEGWKAQLQHGHVLPGHCQLNPRSAKRARRRMRAHAAATASRHWFAALARNIRSVERETRWRWRLKVLWTAACMLRKRWAERADLNRCILRSRRRTG